MKPIEEIKIIVNGATDTILKEQRKDPTDIVLVIDQAYMILMAKAQTFDDISEVLEKEDANWWN